ncbi:Defensin-like protein - like 8 [Theobroma cacao]|nr:Defensin-like protein - like 8 [Theobroma cacao]
MKNLQISAIFIFVLFFSVVSTGNMVMAEDQGTVCAIPFRFPNCNDAVCKRSCESRFPPNGNGMCRGDSICLCFHPC